MTRKAIYSTALVAVVAATAMTVASIVTPNWISYSVTAKSGDTVYDHIGLHQRCTSTATDGCTHFPDERSCQEDGGSFCNMWRTTGFLMSLAVVMDLVTMVGFLVIMAGGKAKRETGWPILCVMLGIVAALHFGAMAIVGYVFDNDDIFHVPGYTLDACWCLCMASGAVATLSGFGLAISAFVLPPQEGYIFLRDSTDV